MNGVSIVFHLKLGKTYSHAPPSLPAHSLLTTIHNLHIYYINAVNLQSSQAEPSKISSESTNPASINQVEPLLIRQYNSSNGFHAWHVQYTHSTYSIFLLKIISKGPVHRQLNSIVDKAQIKSAPKARADNNPGLEKVSVPRFSRNTFRSTQPNISQIFPSLLLPGDGSKFIIIISHTALFDRDKSSYRDLSADKT